MRGTAPAHTTAKGTRTHPTTRPAAVRRFVLAVTVIGSLVAQSTSSAPSFGEVLRYVRGDPAVEAGDDVTEAEGAIPAGVTVFDDDLPGIVDLDPGLLDVLRDAATDAAADGITFYVNSGWRSAEYQDQLLREAVAEYGSEEEAARWVATADSSAHVSGDAVDIRSGEATEWLSEHGAGYGLCQIYANEPWHYELRADAVDRGCPRMYDDPTQDPRMQR